MFHWFTIPAHIIFLLCMCAVIIIGEGTIIFILIKKKTEKKYGDSKLSNTVKWLENFWGPFVLYVLATSIICLFIVSLVDEDNITLSDMNNWVSIVLGLVALIVGVISLWLSYYNVEQANKSQEAVEKEVKRINIGGTGWQEVYPGVWIYKDRYGETVKNAWKESGASLYYLGEDGILVKNREIFKKDNIYYADESGAIVKEKFIKIGDKERYFGKDGAAIKTGTEKIDGKEYSFKDGYVVK